MVRGKRLCLIILILSDVDSFFLVNMRSEAEYDHQKDDWHHTELHLLHTLYAPDLHFFMATVFQIQQAVREQIIPTLDIVYNY